MWRIWVVVLVAALACGKDSDKADSPEKATDEAKTESTAAGETKTETPAASDPVAPKIDRSARPESASDEMLDAMDAFLAALYSMHVELGKVGSEDCAKATAVLERHEAAIKAANEPVKKFETAAKDPAVQKWLGAALPAVFNEINKADAGVVKECNMVKKDETFGKTYMRVTFPN